MEPNVIYEDDSILVLDKPSGWIVNEAATTTSQPVVQAWLKKMFNYPLIGDSGKRDGIVHRLDKETSGILLVAKTSDVFEALQAQFKQRKVEKRYVALVHGKVEPVKGEIKNTVGRLPWRRDRFGVIPGGRESETAWQVISILLMPATSEILSLVEFFPKTGRTHQIRIHAKYMNHPVVSDKFYAGRKTARKDEKWCPRLFLHASKISFIHPKTDKVIEFKSELPEDLTSALLTLEKLQQTP